MVEQEGKEDGVDGEKRREPVGMSGGGKKVGVESTL